MRKNDKIYITGHKNPDTDSVCAAIGYAYLKNHLDGDKYMACRAGQLNEETKFVLNHFGLPAPEYIKDVRPQVSDIEIEQVEPVHPDISLKTAWGIMRENKVNTLPITHEDGSLSGVITVGDITKSYMEDADRTIVSKAKTPFENLVHTLDATVICDYKSDIISNGKVVVAAANPDVMEDYMDPDDIIIVGNRYETQVCALEMDCACIIVSYGSPVSRTIQKMAREKKCAVLVSPHDTYNIARIINQSIPISYFMTDQDIISFGQDSFIEDIQSVMATRRFREFPIIEDGKYIGLISRRNLMNVHKKQVIMVDHNEKGQAVDGIEQAKVLEIIDHHKIGSLETDLPIYFRNQPLGCTSTIVYQMYRENNVEIPKEIAGALCSAIISDTLLFRSPTCTPYDRMVCEELAKEAGINLEDYSQKMFSAGSNMDNKTAEEIFFQDFKKFVVGKKRLGVGQINIVDVDKIPSVREKLMPYLEESLTREKLDVIYFMLTDIFEETTYLLYVGDGAEDIIKVGFNVEPDDGIAKLVKIVSRKKQLIPMMIHAVHELEEADEK